jgi:hypothetical protein
MFFRVIIHRFDFIGAYAEIRVKSTISVKQNV